MKYILTNITVTNDSVLENKITEILKRIPYASKKNNKQTKVCEFDYVLFPIDETLISEFDDVKGFITSHCGGIDYDNAIKDSDMLFGFQALYDSFAPLANKSFTMQIVKIVNSNELSLFYTDGSSSPKVDKCGFATIQINKEIPEDKLTENLDEDIYYELLTKSHYTIIAKSGSVDNGTNNIGELTGVKVAVENMTDKTYQVIISDSEYALKSYREWIHTWKANGYKTAAKKEISNKDIITATQSLIEKSGKIYLFQWVKGHNDLELNDMCDMLAKKEIGLL